jgi:CubicO group peptidase (beta-lactamase class C family)
MFTETTRRAFIGTGLISILAYRAGATPSGSDAAFIHAAGAAVEQAERDDGFSGVILVARGDQVLLRKAAGFADRDRNIPNTTYTKFPLESVTKQFTAAAIMLLVQAGKISLNDAVSKYYAASPPAWQNLTIKHLLTHSSGIEDYWVHRHQSVDESDFLNLYKSSGDFFRLVQDDALGFEPGSGFSYSNAGYALLALVIEQASGQPYHQFLRNRFFAPLEMPNTGIGPIPDGVLKGYVRSLPDGAWRRGRVFELDEAAGFGGVYSTLDDMLIWSRSLDKGTILSPPSRQAMLTDYGHNYGFGWRLAPKFGRKLIWHTGNDAQAGFASILDRFPEEELTVVVMTNNTGLTDAKATLVIEGKPTTFPANAARKLIEHLERLYFGKDP